MDTKLAIKQEKNKDTMPNQEATTAFQELNLEKQCYNMQHYAPQITHSIKG